MKTLSDYKGNEAIELWSDLLEPITMILGDPEMAKELTANKAPLLKAQTILKKYAAETEKILLRIDPEPLDGLNIIVRLTSIIVEVGQRDDVRAFFASAGQAKMENGSGGSVTENTEAEEK